MVLQPSGIYKCEVKCSGCHNVEPWHLLNILQYPRRLNENKYLLPTFLSITSHLLSSLHIYIFFPNPQIPSASFTVVLRSLSCVRLFATLWTTACQASLSFTISWSLLKLMSIKLVMPSYHHIWPKYQSIGFSISPSNKYSDLIYFWIDCVSCPWCPRATQESFQHYSSKASIFQCSAFFNCSTLTSIHDYWKNHRFG